MLFVSKFKNQKYKFANINTKLIYKNYDERSGRILFSIKIAVRTQWGKLSY
jgi:hypothetical protein